MLTMMRTLKTTNKMINTTTTNKLESEDKRHDLLEEDIDCDKYDNFYNHQYNDKYKGRHQQQKDVFFRAFP